ncbi:MAG: TIGR03545 family protein [Gammaproteobacteria bacterium]|nr:TIGR03545 family protein [Gammaproteobacteria bacterium]
MRIFRTSFLIVIAVFGILGGLTYWVFSSGIVERAIERKMTTAFDAKVDIDALSFNIFNMGAGYDRLRIGDKDQPMRNLVETGSARFRMELSPLLMGKVVIDDLSVEQIGVHTPRKDSAAIHTAPPATPPNTANTPPPAAKSDAAPAPTAPPTAAPATAWDKLAAKTPKIDLQALEQRVDVTGLVKQGGLGTTRYISEIKDSRTQMFKDWDERINNSKLDKDFAALLADINRIDLGGIKDPKSAKSALDTLKSAREKHDKLKSTFNGMNFEAQRDLATLKDTWQGLNQRTEDDITALKRLAKLGSIDTRDAAQMVFGPAILQQFSEVNGYLARAKRIVAGKPAEKAPPRRAGVNIQFPLERPRPPDFLIRRIGINGTLADQKTKLSGEVIGITTEPDAYGQPTTLQLRTATADQGTWKITGLFDHRKSQDLDRLAFKGDNIDLGRVSLHNEANNPMPKAFHPQASDITLALQTDQNILKGEFSLVAPKVDFEFDTAPTNATGSVVRKVFADIRDVHIDGQIGGTWSNPTLNLKSNIDNILSQRLGQIIQEKTAAVERQIRQEVDALVQKEKANVDIFIKEKQTALESRIKTLASSNTEVAKAVEKYQKDIEKKAGSGAKEVGKQLENKAKDKLKSLKF